MILTEREVRVLIYASHGFTYGQMGRRLGMTDTAAKQVMYRIRPKLGARDRAHAVAIALRKGMIK